MRKLEGVWEFFKDWDRDKNGDWDWNGDWDRNGDWDGNRNEDWIGTDGYLLLLSFLLSDSGMDEEVEEGAEGWENINRLPYDGADVIPFVSRSVCG